MKPMNRRELCARFGLAGLALGALRGSHAHAQTSTAPRRVVFFYLPGGLWAGAWRPSQAAASGVAIDAPTYGQMDPVAKRWRHALQTFDAPKYQPLKRDLMLIDGLDMRAIARPDIHVNGIAAALRGRPAEAVEPEERGTFPGYSLDRVIGQSLDRAGRGDAFLVSQCTNVLVSELGQQANVASHSQGYGARAVRTSGEAWDVFLKDLVGNVGSPDNAAEVARLRAEIDRWTLSEASTKRVAAALPSEEAARVAELASTFRDKIDDLGRRITQLGTRAVPALDPRGLPVRPTDDPDPSRLMKEKSARMAKVMALALALNRTQVVVWQTFGSNNDKGLWYAGGTLPDFHNAIAHGGAPRGVIAPATWEVYDAYMQMLGDLLLELRAIPEAGGGTLLDSTLVLTYSDMCDGGHHTTVPCLTLAAGARNARLDGKALRLGQYVKLPTQRAHNDWLFTVGRMMGVTQARDGAGKLVDFDSFGTTTFNKGLLDDALA